MHLHVAQPFHGSAAPRNAPHPATPFSHETLEIPSALACSPIFNFPLPDIETQPSLVHATHNAMSSTMVLTMADTPTKLPVETTTTTLSTSSASTCCPSCGDSTVGLDASVELRAAHSRIAELETQVRLLNQKATAAVDRWADYEDELQRLRAAHDNDAGPPPPPPKEEQKRISAGISAGGGLLATGTNRLSALLNRNKSSPNLAQDGFPQGQRPREPTRTRSQPEPDTEDLLHALRREKSLRKEAETKVAATSQEVEELSASLFEQANEMVADERRARAKLEERVDELERRDRAKSKRLERLESAMGRIDRVRKVLDETKP